MSRKKLFLPQFYLIKIFCNLKIKLWTITMLTQDSWSLYFSLWRFGNKIMLIFLWPGEETAIRNHLDSSSSNGLRRHRKYEVQGAFACTQHYPGCSEKQPLSQDTLRANWIQGRWLFFPGSTPGTGAFQNYMTSSLASRTLNEARGFVCPEN